MYVCVVRVTVAEGGDPSYPQLSASPQSMDSMLTPGDGERVCTHTHTHTLHCTTPILMERVKARPELY